MRLGRRQVAAFTLFVSVASASGCGDDDDLSTEVVAEDQAEAVIPWLVGLTTGFSLELVDIVRAATMADSSVAAATERDGCTPIPSFCTDPLAGVICPADAMASVCRFSECDRGLVSVQMNQSLTLDGTVTLTGSAPHDVTFDLGLLPGHRFSGQARVMLDPSCATVELVELANENPRFSSTAVGRLETCEVAQSGSVQALVSGTGFRPAAFEISLDGDEANIAVIDVATREQLYQCRWRRPTDIPTGEVPPPTECRPYGT
jgi:hypothetical protein